VAQGRACAAILAGRPPLRSPGRPPVNRREERQRFWRLIAGGLSGEEAAAGCGVSMPLGPRWFREGWRYAVDQPGPAVWPLPVVR
jgi:hypothetical protein